MNALLKNLGVVIVLIGACLLIAHSQILSPSNLWLIGGIGSIVVGILTYILIYRFEKK